MRDRLLPQDFDRNGVSISEDFLSKKEVDILLREIERNCRKRMINGQRGGIRLDPGYLLLTEPCLTIRSVNLLEIALRIHQHWSEISANFASKRYRLVDIQIYREEGNEKPLFWHTDERFGMLRAQIYIQGGQSDSGAFLYMRGSHQRDFYVTHMLDHQQEVKMAREIVQCSAPVGSLVAFDSFGFHAKAKCAKPRINIMFEFQEDSGSYSKPQVVISPFNLTQKILDNIHIFTLPAPEEPYVGGDFDGEERPLGVLEAFRALKMASWKYIKAHLVRVKIALRTMLFKPEPQINQLPPEQDLEKRAGYKQWRTWKEERQLSTAS